MIEQVIVDALKKDSVIKTLVTRYAHDPAVFSELAPEAAKEPYITINLSRNSTNSLVLMVMNLQVDVWGYDTTRVDIRKISERIEFVFDNKIFQKPYNTLISDSRYTSIRIWFFSGGWIEEEDPRAVRYNQQFTVRACRKKWVDQL